MLFDKLLIYVKRNFINNKFLSSYSNDFETQISYKRQQQKVHLKYSITNLFGVLKSVKSFKLNFLFVVFKGGGPLFYWNLCSRSAVASSDLLVRYHA